MRYFLLALLLIYVGSAVASSAPPELRKALINEDPEQFLEQAILHPDENSSSYWMELALAYLQLYQKENALHSINQAIDLARLLDDQPLYQAQLQHVKAQILGRLYRNTELGIEALHQAVLWLEPLTSDAARTEKAEIYESLAQAYNQHSSLQQAVYYAEKSLAEAMQPRQKLNAHFLLGRLYLQMNHISQAFSHFDKTTELATELQAFHAYPLIHLRYGLAYQKMGLPQQALEAFFRAKDGFAEHQEQRNYINTLLRIVSLQLENHALDGQSYGYLEQALQFSQQLPDQMRIAEAKFQMGQWHLYHQQLNEAHYYFEKAQALFSQIGAQESLRQVQLALIESFIQQEQLAAAIALFQQLNIQHDNPNLPLFIRYRSAELGAGLAARQLEWQQAYHFSEQARALRFNDLQEQYNLKLDYLQFRQPPQPEQSKPQWYAAGMYSWGLMALSALLLLLLLLAVHRLQRLKQTSPASQLIFSRQWIQFSDRLVTEQRAKLPLHLMAITLRDCQQYKQLYGEVQLRRVLISLLQSFKLPQIVQLTIHSDVLWLGLCCQRSELAALESKILCHLAQQRTQLQPQPHLQTLILPLQELLGEDYQSGHIQALREAVWLSWYLANQLNPAQQHMYLQLKVQESRPCEWMTENIRQDLLNALQLGSIELWQQDRLLNPQLKALLD